MVEGTREVIDARSRNGRETDPRSRVRGVACGGGFTVVVTNGGKVQYATGSPEGQYLTVERLSRERKQP